MLFKMIKASKPDFHEDNKPCEKAFIHTYDNGAFGISKVWMVEINTLEDLLALRDEVHEELVIGQNDWITIYDDFIE